jgi:hypothetical protein
LSGAFDVDSNHNQQSDSDSAIAAPLRTVREIAASLGIGWWRVDYVLRLHPEIRMAARIGTYRMYDDAGVEAIAQAVELHARQPRQQRMKKAAASPAANDGTIQGHANDRQSHQRAQAAGS